MVPSVAALLSLLGAAALAGVRSAPVEKDGHVEEMLTRCIVEVLLNGLSKASAPPINPQCKELLKKSNHQKQEEQNEGQNLELNTRHLLESEELGKPLEGTVKEEQDLNEEEFKREAEGGEKWHLAGGKQAENGHPQGTSHSFDEAHKEEKENDDDKRAEEDGSHKWINHSGAGSKAKKHNEEAEHELLEKKSLPTAGKVAEEDYKRSGGQRYLEEIVHSEEKGKEESKEEEDTEEDEEESSEKYHHSFHQEYEDSSERGEDDIEKRGRKPRHYHRKSRLDTSEYKRHHNREKKASSEESSEEESEFWDKRSHDPKHYYKTGHLFEEKRNSDEMHGSEEMEEKKRSREYQDRWPHSREDNEEEDMRHHSRENEEKRHHYERKRLFDEPQSEVRYNYEERTPHSKGSEDEGKPQSYDSRDEKRTQHDKERQHSQLEEMPKQQNIEKEEGEQRLYNPGEQPREEKRHSGHAGEGELEKRHYNEREKHVGNKRTLLMEEGYPRSHYLVENVKRAVPPYIPYYQQLQWKSRHPEKKDEATDPFLESEEEPKSRPNEGDFFPEYSDYDLWEKKPFMDGLNHKRNENNHLERSHKLDGKRQYNRMDELAHLLSYRKKSAEFPELYSSKEDVKRGHVVRNGEGKLSQRPLTQEEEKELEDLAAMDLELQKIAEKFNNNRRG
ncbi:secretogranin-1 [Elgaria multicarinata webbii]|uniref:secretogranin-1 n=1 Tax=Elgaria multicarinata webbii TaxID=159646 RepID=UPI002FCD6ABF